MHAMTRLTKRIPRDMSHSAAITLAALLLAACAYDPPMQADHASAAYRADLKACDASGSKEADRIEKAYAWRYYTYPISYPFERRSQIRKCMTGKGYVRRD